MSARVADRHRLWFVTLLVTAGVGMLGAVQGLGWDRALLAALVTGALGAIVGLAWIDDAAATKHPLLRGAALTVLVGLGLPGLVLALGVWAAAAIGLLTITSPWVIHAVGAGWSRTLSTSGRSVQAAIGNDDLLREWVASTRELAHSQTPSERTEMVAARAAILDDILRRSEGRIPELVWWSVDEPHAAGRERPGR